MSNGPSEKLKRSRRSRSTFGARLHVRITDSQLRALDAIATATGRSVSDLVRTAIESVIGIGQRVGPIEAVKENRQKVTPDVLTSDDRGDSLFDIEADRPTGESDNIRYV